MGIDKYGPLIEIRLVLRWPGPSRNFFLSCGEVFPITEIILQTRYVKLNQIAKYRDRSYCQLVPLKYWQTNWWFSRKLMAEEILLICAPSYRLVRLLPPHRPAMTIRLANDG